MAGSELRRWSGTRIGAGLSARHRTGITPKARLGQGACSYISRSTLVCAKPNTVLTRLIAGQERKPEVLTQPEYLGVESRDSAGPASLQTAAVVRIYRDEAEQLEGIADRGSKPYLQGRAPRSPRSHYPLPQVPYTIYSNARECACGVQELNGARKAGWLTSKQSFLSCFCFVPLH